MVDINIERRNYHKSKLLLFTQSFFPLFVLLAIRHFNIEALPLIPKFLNCLIHGDSSIFMKAFSHTELWNIIVVLVSIIGIDITLIFMAVFKEMQTAGFTSSGEKITKLEYHRSAGLNFFASYLLPLIIDIDGFQDFLVFSGMLLLIFIMVWRTNLYYENPALTIWRYQSFSFVTDNGLTGIGITRGNAIDKKRVIKKKQIIDNLYFIYNE